MTHTYTHRHTHRYMTKRYRDITHLLNDIEPYKGNLHRQKRPQDIKNGICDIQPRGVLPTKDKDGRVNGDDVNDKYISETQREEV